MLIKDLMVKSPPTVSTKTQAKEIVKVFLSGRVDLVGVVDEEGELVGIMTPFDLLKGLLPEPLQMAEGLAFALEEDAFEDLAGELADKRAEDMMEPAKFLIAADAHIVDACEKILLNKVRNLPVFEDEKFVGVVGVYDILKALDKT